MEINLLHLSKKWFYKKTTTFISQWCHRRIIFVPGKTF